MQLEPLSLRLGFMRVKVTAADETERRALANGITLPWLRKVLPELDLPQAYENLIRDAFMGSASESAFVKEHRRECLIEPWRLMLQLQGTCARLQKQINHDEWQVLNIAIDGQYPASLERCRQAHRAPAGVPERRRQGHATTRTHHVVRGDLRLKSKSAG